MAKAQVGLRELKSKLGRYVRRAAGGEPVTITSRGKPVARIVPAGRTVEERLTAMAAAGELEWDGRKFPVGKPVAKLRGGVTISDLVIAGRE